MGDSFSISFKYNVIGNVMMMLIAAILIINIMDQVVQTIGMALGMCKKNKKKSQVTYKKSSMTSISPENSPSKDQSKKFGKLMTTK